jgi:hypothetical protein
MLSFVSSAANASVIGGLKLHPELNIILAKNGSISIPDDLMKVHGEWIESDIINKIYMEANRICPDYSIYRHTSCALANVFAQPNHTATIFREDICPPSHCPILQRKICEQARVIPDETQVFKILTELGKTSQFKCLSDQVEIYDTVTQEEFSYLLHTLNCPIEVEAIKFENLYRGSIHTSQKDATLLTNFKG